MGNSKEQGKRRIVRFTGSRVDVPQPKGEFVNLFAKELEEIKDATPKKQGDQSKE